MSNNVTTGETITFCTDDWAGDGSQIPAGKILWGGRGTGYTWLDDAPGARLPVKVGDPLPAGTNVIGHIVVDSGSLAVTQSGSWSVSVIGSVAVTGTFWQSTQPISASALPLPSGAATSAKQDSIVSALGSPFQAGGSIGNSTFGATKSGTWAVDSIISLPPITFASAQPVTQSGAWSVSVSNWPATQAISAASLPLPSNAAQETGGNLATLAGTVSSGKLSVHVADASVAVTQSGAWSVGITGSVAVTGTFWQTTQPVSAAALPLPANAAQETGGNLATIATNTAGASTATRQDTGNASLATIATNLPVQGQALAPASVPVILASDSDTIRSRIERRTAEMNAIEGFDTGMFMHATRGKERVTLIDRRGSISRGR